LSKTEKYVILKQFHFKFLLKNTCPPSEPTNQKPEKELKLMDFDLEWPVTEAVMF
jgi:hypothetical protein